MICTLAICWAALSVVSCAFVLTAGLLMWRRNKMADDDRYGPHPD